MRSPVNLRGVLICSLPGLLCISNGRATRHDIARIYIDAREGLLVAMNAEMMVWVHVPVATARDAFTVDGALCQQALKATSTDEGSIEIRLTNVLQDARHKILLYSRAPAYPTGC